MPRSVKPRNHRASRHRQVEEFARPRVEEVEAAAGDYADRNQPKIMTIRAHEFIRRFLLHTLPLGLQRIRYYGLLGNRRRTENLARCRQLLHMQVPETDKSERAPPRDYRSRYEALTGRSLHQCPACLQGCMRLVEQIPRPQQRAELDTS